MKHKVKGGWEETVKSWYCGYSKHEKLLVLNTQNRMIDFISDILASERQRCVDSIDEWIENSTEDLDDLRGRLEQLK